MLDRISPQTKWFIKLLAKYFLAVLVIVAYTLAVARVAQKKALKQYEAWLDDYKAVDRMEIDAHPADPQEEKDAELLAKVLYGVKDNSTDDMKTLCWCVFNRVDNPDYPGTLEEVVNQPQQWMRYSDDNPVVESLYQVAKEQLDLWQTGGRRPCMNTFVFMNWTASDICLRDNWREGNNTHYWRWNQ